MLINVDEEFLAKKDKKDTPIDVAYKFSEYIESQLSNGLNLTQ